jgi:hypothetical protein
MKFKKNKLKSGSTRRNKETSTLFNSQVRHLLKWLIRTYGINPSVWDPCCHYMRFLEHIDRHKGKQTALLLIKEHRLKVMHFLENRSSQGHGLTHDGIPLRLSGFAKYLRNKNALEIKFLLTLLYSLRRITLPLNPNLETVTSPGTEKDLFRILRWIPLFSKALSRLLKKKYKIGKLLKFPEWSEYHLTTKGSPSGGQALLYCLQDLVNIPESLIKSISTVGGKLLESNMKKVLSQKDVLSELLYQPIRPNQSFRKLSAISDSEGKTRLIAIGDYWSQTCLKPWHDYLNHVLSKIPQDQTFNQGEGLSELTFDSSLTYYCYDLTAFTDRFPSRILLGLLTVNCGLPKAIAWYDIMNGYDFDYKSPKGLKSNIRYSIGNPMGFYSSWPLTTLCHHLVLFVACQECNISWNKSNYKLLGDDIIIWDSALALKYKELISHIGVDISEQKSHVSNSIFEFAKRIFTPYGEISPFSIKAGLSETKSYLGFFELLTQFYKKGWSPNISWFRVATDFYLSHPNRFRRKALTKQISKVEDSYIMYKRLNGHLSDSELIRHFLMTLNYPLTSCCSQTLSKDLFVNTIVQVFEQSASSYSTDIMLRLERALMYYTDLEGEDRSEFVYAHPYSFVVGKFVEETYLLTMKKAYDFDTLYSGEWLPYFRVLKASDGTSILTDRNYIKPRSSSPLLIRKLRETVYTLAHNPYF